MAQADSGAPGAPGASRAFTEYGTLLERVRLEHNISRGLIGYRVTSARAEQGQEGGKRGGGYVDATHVRRWMTGEYLIDPTLAGMLHEAIEATPDERRQLWRAYLATHISNAGAFPDEAREALGDLDEGEVRELFARAIDERPEVEGLPTEKPAASPAAVAQTGRSQRSRQASPVNPITKRCRSRAGCDPLQVDALTLPRETVSPRSVAA